MVYQTVIQKRKAIRFNSAKVEAGEAVESLIDIGVSANIEFSDTFDVKTVKPENGPEDLVGVYNHRLALKFELWEFDLDNFALLRGDLDTITNIPGDPVTVTNEVHTLTGVEAVRLNYKNGSGAIVTAVSVTDGSGNAAVQNTDYVLFLDSSKYTCIARVSGSAVISTGETAKVTYTYTPNVAKKLTSGGKNEISPNVIRLTNTDEAGKIFQITVYKATNEKGITLKLPADNSGEILKPVIELKGSLDTTRTLGDQLFSFYDEQGVF
jgi:hypothetical protein